MLERGCGCLVLLAVLFVAGCSAIVNTALPPLSGRGADGPVTGWKVDFIMRPTTDDTLDLRAAPGNDQPVVAQLPARETRVVTLGQAYRVDGMVWIDVQVANSNQTGWVAQADVVPDNEQIVSG
jgi:hypothetical protein